jgi:DNA-binding transcriptional MerR regulator
MKMTANEKRSQETAHIPAGAVAEIIDDKIPVIPDRMYFRIGDVAEIAGVQPYVLRFWEKEFEFLAPVKNAAGQRLYRKGDVESVLLIKRLLYLERYSIEGAKKRIKELRKAGGLAEAKKERASLDDQKIDAIRFCKEELRALIEMAR